jgi:hypothetical protein
MYLSSLLSWWCLITHSNISVLAICMPKMPGLPFKIPSAFAVWYTNSPYLNLPYPFTLLLNVTLMPQFSLSMTSLTTCFL